MKILRGIFALLVILFLLTIALNNTESVSITLFGDYTLKNIPLFIVIFLSFVFGSLLNLLFLLLSSRKK